MAKGEIIWIAESDDFCEPTLLEELVYAYVNSENIVLAYNPTTLIDDNGHLLNHTYIGDNQYILGNDYLCKYLALYNFVLNASCAIFSKDAALNVTKEYTKYQGSGDYLFWVEIVKQGNVAIVNKRLSYFCRHTGTVTSKKGLEGVHQIEDMRILNRIKEIVPFSKLRLTYTMAYHYKIQHKYIYSSREIAKTIAGIWEYDKYGAWYYQLIVKIANRIRLYTNYFI